MKINPIFLRNFFGCSVGNTIVSVVLVTLLWMFLGKEPSRDYAIAFVLVVGYSVLSGILTLGLMITQWVIKKPTRVTWLDVGLGFAGLSWAIWIFLKILLPTLCNEETPWGYYRIFLGTATLGVMFIALKFRTNPHCEPLFVKWH